MFSPEELSECLKSEWLNIGYTALERALLEIRLGLKPQSPDTYDNDGLNRFTQAVIASASTWDNPRSGVARELCLRAADIEGGLGVLAGIEGREGASDTHGFRSALLYELAGMPGAAASAIVRAKYDQRIQGYFGRARGTLWGSVAANDSMLRDLIDRYQSVDVADHDALTQQVVGELAVELGRVLQGNVLDADALFAEAHDVAKVISRISCAYTGDEFLALSRTFSLRRESATFSILSHESALDAFDLRSLNLPLELWPVQRQAIATGLLRKEQLSYGLAAPTGTGKTSLTRVLLADFFAKERDRKVLYVAPSRSLVHQIAADLTDVLGKLGVVVAGLGEHLTIHEELMPIQDDHDVVVFTPERADLLMRVAPEFIEKVGLVVVDEAHHIEQGNRGILLEFHLWRLRELVPSDARIVQLSAVTPNISQLVEWLGPPDASTAVKLDWRTNRLRLGIFQRSSDGSATVKFENGKPFTLFPAGEFPRDFDLGLAKLANKLATGGIVLVLATSPGRAETIANAIADQRAGVAKSDIPGMATDLVAERLDARAERELFAEAPLRECFKKGVVYHHAELPPRVRSAVEEAISEKRVEIVCATTTLAEGVNFPFATVVVESLKGKFYEISPRTLWNIAGRAGRFGVDSEGHCILYQPEEWAHKLKNYKLADYISTKLDDIPPVKSALASAIEELLDITEAQHIDLDELSSLNLSALKIDPSRPKQQLKRVRGLINLIRVGYAHASTSGIISLKQEDAPEFSQRKLLASKQLSDHARSFANNIAIRQRRVVRDAFQSDRQLLEIAAKIGWSLDVQANIYAWLSTRQDWQLEQYGKMVVGGRLFRPDTLGYLLGPVSKMMAEFGGENLGGMTAFISAKWIEGLPLSEIRDGQEKKPRFGDLVSTIYGDIQYMLPWALFGVSELLVYEAQRRNLFVGTGVRDLSALASEGVPSFDALQLVVRLGIERVDATRLADAYARRQKTQTDVVGWLRGADWNTVAGVVRGWDRRRLDPDLRLVWEKLRADEIPPEI